MRLCCFSVWWPLRQRQGGDAEAGWPIPAGPESARPPATIPQAGLLADRGVHFLSLFTRRARYTLPPAFSRETCANQEKPGRRRPLKPICRTADFPPFVPRFFVPFSPSFGCRCTPKIFTNNNRKLQASGLHAAPCRHGTTRRVVRRLAGFGRVRPHEVAGNDDGVVDFV